MGTAGGGRAKSKGRGPVQHRLCVPAPAPHPGAEAICTPPLLLLLRRVPAAAAPHPSRVLRRMPHLGLVCAATHIVGRALHAMHLLLLLLLVVLHLLLVELLVVHVLYLGREKNAEGEPGLHGGKVLGEAGAAARRRGTAVDAQ